MAMNGELLVTAKLRAAKKERRKHGNAVTAWNARLRKAFDDQSVRYAQFMRNGWEWLDPVPQSPRQLHPTKGYH